MATKIQDKISSKNIKETHNMSYYGTATVGFGDVYITQDVVTDVNLSAPTAACEACGEEAAFVTSATLTKTTEENLMPLICSDEYGNFQQVVRSTDRDDTTTTRESHGVIRFGNTIDGE
mgnify:CR=1 FL=1|jgi:hypothetical protein|tara:strand:- start:3359 stop:3715 length:357 start_codon:yes stop_codon:yes gene_type:complete